MLGLRTLIFRVTVWQTVPALVIVLLLAVLWRRGWPVLVTYGAVGGVVIVVNGILSRRWLRGICRQLRKNQCRFCVECGYNLADSPDSGNCPECGVAYEIEAVREKWRTIVRYDRKQAGRRAELGE